MFVNECDCAPMTGSIAKAYHVHCCMQNEGTVYYCMYSVKIKDGEKIDLVFPTIHVCLVARDL